MANYYYILKVVDCRGKSDASSNPTARQTANTAAENPKGTWEFRFNILDTTAGPAKNAFLAAVYAALPTAPGMVKYVTQTPFFAAITDSADTTNDGLPARGFWSERVGKRFLRYEIGVSTASFGNAQVNLTAHDMA
jgi:hypothetical protein